MKLIAAQSFHNWAYGLHMQFYVLFAFLIYSFLISRVEGNDSIFIIQLMQWYENVWICICQSIHQVDEELWFAISKWALSANIIITIIIKISINEIDLNAMHGRKFDDLDEANVHSNECVASCTKSMDSIRSNYIYRNKAICIN